MCPVAFGIGVAVGVAGYFFVPKLARWVKDKIPG
jgi:hypothetical protein